MSSALAVLALGSTFGAVLLVSVSVQTSRQVRRRAEALLQTQVGDVAVPDQREEELAKPLAERVVLPVAGALGAIGKRITPSETRDRLTRKLVLAGSPAGWDAEKLVAFKVVGLGGMLLIGWMLAKAAHLHGIVGTGLPFLMGATGYAMPGAWLGQAAAKRQESIRRALPDTMDLLTISVEAGLGFDAALAQVVRNVPGALSEEIARLLQEMQLGVNRVDAFRHLAERTDVDELRGFTLAMIQADIFGVSIANVLRAQAKDLRIKRRQRAEKKAMTSPLKLLFPLIFCVLPALFVVVLGPGAIRILHNFFGIGK
jgi:tight adherence protein C